MELTFRAIALGSLIGLVFGAANAYLALKVGMTISASIPAAVMSMALLRGVLKKGSVKENNIVQTIGSSGEGLAAGIVFTIPAFILLDLTPAYFTVVAMAILGGFLGILFMIPLRHALIVKEHETLPYPEGTACAQVLLAGDRGGNLAQRVLVGALVGGVYRLLVSGWRIGAEAWTWALGFLKGGSLGAEFSPALLGVGYLIGPRIAAVVCAGGLMGSVVLSPLIALVGTGEMTPGQIRASYIRYIGAGAVAFGGLMSLWKSLPTLMAFFRRKKGDRADEEAETGKDLPFSFVIASALAVALAIWILPAFSLNGVGALLVVCATFLFVAVSSRIVGLVGSSSNPVSGMTIATLIVTSLIFVRMGFSGAEGMRASLSVGALVCIAVCMAGDASQDLKTGFLVGATPWRQQIAEFIGVVVPAFAIGWVIMALHRAYGIGSDQLSAPQASLMATIVKGVMEGNMPWGLVVMGMGLSAVVELLGVASLPFAIGLYLPLTLSLPMLLGGVIAWRVASSRSWDEPAVDNGVLVTSGMIAGDALAGLALVPLFAVPALAAWRNQWAEGWLLGEIGTALAFGGVAWWVWREARKPG